MSERTCSKCGVTKPETPEFFRRRGTRDRGGLRPDCRVCSAARDKAYYQANRQWFQTYRAENRERLAAYQARYWKTYPLTEQGRAAHARAKGRWKNAGGRAVIARAAQRRRARKAGLPSAFTAEDWQICLEWFEHRCAYCAATGPLTQDHVIPVVYRGAYVPDNVIPACRSCNSRKNASLMEPWYRRQEFFDEERLMLIVMYTETARAE